MELYLKRDKKVTGPHTLEQLLEWRTGGSLQDSDLVFSARHPDPRPFGEIVAAKNGFRKIPSPMVPTHQREAKLPSAIENPLFAAQSRINLARIQSESALWKGGKIVLALCIVGICAGLLGYAGYLPIPVNVATYSCAALGIYIAIFAVVFFGFGILLGICALLSWIQERPILGSLAVLVFVTANLLLAKAGGEYVVGLYASIIVGTLLLLFVGSVRVTPQSYRAISMLQRTQIRAELHELNDHHHHENF